MASARELWKRYGKWALLGCLCLAIGMAVIWIQFGTQIREFLPEARHWAQEAIRTIPPYLYWIAFVVLPMLGAPLTLFYLTAIPVFGDGNIFLGLAGAWSAVLVNMLLSYYVSIGIFHPLIEKIIQFKGLKIPKIEPAKEWKIVLTCRISPLPFQIQNYLLALGHSRLRFYLWFSLPIQAAIGSGMMLVGKSLFSGGLSIALLGLFLIMLFSLLTPIIRKKLKRDGRFQSSTPSQ